MLDSSIEMWKSIDGYVGYYEVSSYGRIRSLPRKVNFINGTTRNLKGKILKHMVDINGYEYVMLACCGEQERKFVHRLVAEAFLEQEDPSYEVNHIDGNKQNNNITNLEWVSHRQNIKHSFDIGLHCRYSSEHMRNIGKIGNQVSIAKSSIPVICVSDMIAFVSQNAADRYYGYHAGSVSDAISKRNGKFKNKIFRRLSTDEQHNFNLLS